MLNFYTFLLYTIITSFVIVLSLFSAFAVSDFFQLPFSAYLFLVPIFYVFWFLLYYSINKLFPFLSHSFNDREGPLTSHSKVSSFVTFGSKNHPASHPSNLDIHYEDFEKFQERNAVIKHQVEMLKLSRILAYTQATFCRLNFSDEEIFQLCQCVNFFVTHGSVLSDFPVTICKKDNITQISLKNFAWNVANQYGISGDLAAEFVIITFRQWFANTTVETVRKTLKTSIGKHEIMIDLALSV